MAGPGSFDNAEDGGEDPTPEPGDNNPETVSGDGDGSINHVLAEQNGTPGKIVPLAKKVVPSRI